MKLIRCQAAVVGGGSAGLGAVYRLLKNNITTVVIEKNSGFGGTSVFGGVNAWEPGIGTGNLIADIVSELKNIKDGYGIGRSIPNLNVYKLNKEFCYDMDWNTAHDFKKLFMGLSAIDPNSDYSTTLGRCKAFDSNWARVHFEPDAFLQAADRLIAPYKKNLVPLFGYEYDSCETQDGRIVSIKARNGDGRISIIADEYIDASGDIVLARGAGCKTIMGTEGREAYNEPSAEERDASAINGISYIFRVSKYGQEVDRPQKIELGDWLTKLNKNEVCAVFNVYPNLDMNINMLPTLSGEEYLALGDKADEVGTARAFAYWDFMKKEKGFSDYNIVKIFPLPGIRESWRLIGKYILTEHDIKNGFTAQDKKEELIAYADHALDVHGRSKACAELEVPYGVPFSCLETNEIENLLVACRGSSFSSIAASSCRLSRTMIELGEAAGEAVSQKIMTGAANPSKIRETLMLPQYEEALKREISR